MPSIVDRVVAKYNGVHVDEDGYYGAQCWDLVARIAREFYGCPSFPTVTGGAEGLISRTAPIILQHFDKLGGVEAQAGDIAVFPASFSPPWGHTAYVISRNGNTLKVLEQNGNNPGGAAYIATRYVTQLSGVLRPKKGIDDMSKVDLSIGRILAFFMGGRANALDGASDGDLNANHVGKETNQEIWDWYNSAEGQAWKNRITVTLPQIDILTNQLTAANSALAGLQQQIKDLGSRPTQAQLDELTKAITAANNKAIAAQAELEKLQAQQAADQATGNAFLRWLGDQLNKILGKG